MTTSVRPLMVSLMTPHIPEVIKTEGNTIIYDPTTQQTYYMGGKSGPTRSNDGYKRTERKLPNGRGTSVENDAERYTDD